MRDGGIRSIAVGTIWRRLVYKIFVKQRSFGLLVMEANFVRGCSLQTLGGRCLGWVYSEVMLVKIKVLLRWP
jgi:hypothetical protein